MLEEPRSGLLAAWGNALIAGLVSPDEAASRATGPNTVHRITGLPAGGALSLGAAGGDDASEGPVTLAWGLARLRALGVRGFRVALPVAGHPRGLSGPAEFNRAALAAGEAVLAVGAAPLGLVPEPVAAAGDGAAVHLAGTGAHGAGEAVLWRCLPVNDAPPADVPSLAEAERELQEALREATTVLARMDVAGSGPGAQAALGAYRARRNRSVLAPGYPPRAVRVLESAQRVGALVSIALGRHSGGQPSAAMGAEHGTALSASAMAARAEVLRPLDRTARRAQVAAYNAFLEEAGRRRES